EFIMVKPFAAEPATDFTVEENRRDFQKAMQDVENNLGFTVPLVIDGEHIHTDDTTMSNNPSHKTQAVGYVSKATKNHIDQAMESSEKAFKSWRKWHANDRAELLLRVAAIIRRRKHELSALMDFEAGKPCDQADGDTNEAIDFIKA